MRSLNLYFRILTSSTGSTLDKKWKDPLKTSRERITWTNPIHASQELVDFPVTGYLGKADSHRATVPDEFAFNRQFSYSADSLNFAACQVLVKITKISPKLGNLGNQRNSRVLGTIHESTLTKEGRFKLWKKVRIDEPK